MAGAKPTQMQRDALMLHARVNEYRLTAADVTFWTSYWINPFWLKEGEKPTDGSPYFVNAPLKGKGTPEEIKLELQRILANEPTPPITPEGMRQLMTAHGLGVDCSAFVYHILDGWLQWRGVGTLADHLLVRREEVLGFWKAHPETQDGQAEADVPEFSVLSAVSRAWDRDPKRITNVERLCYPETAQRVSRLDEMRPGDMIRLTGPAGDHVGIIVEVLADRLIWAHSGLTLNGVAYEEIRWAKPEADLDEQIWPREVTYQPSNGLDGVWRLKAIDGD